MALTELLSSLTYDLLDGLKSRSVFSALSAFALSMGMLSASMTKKRVMHKIENKKRLETAFANYGLD